MQYTVGGEVFVAFAQERVEAGGKRPASGKAGAARVGQRLEGRLLRACAEGYGKSGQPPFEPNGKANGRWPPWTPWSNPVSATLHDRVSTGSDKVLKKRSKLFQV